jgi:hypothetical protein
MMRGRITETLIADLQEMALFPGEGRARREERQAQGPAHQTRRPNTHTTTHGEGNDTEPRNTTNHRARDWSGVTLQAPLDQQAFGRLFLHLEELSARCFRRAVGTYVLIGTIFGRAGA